MKLIQEIVDVRFNLTNVEPYPENGFCYVYANHLNNMATIRQGQVMTNKKGKKNKFIKRYKISEETVKKECSFEVMGNDDALDFDVNVMYSIKIEDPEKYILYNIDPIVDDVTDKLNREAIRLGSNFTQESYYAYENELRRDLGDLEDIEDMGIKVEVDATVRINKELKDTNKESVIGERKEKYDHKRKMVREDYDEEYRQKKFEELEFILQDTFYEQYLVLYDNSKELKDFLKEELNSHIRDAKETLESLNKQYRDKMIDKVEYDERMTRFKETSNNSEIINIGKSMKRLELNVETNSTYPDNKSKVAVDQKESDEWN